MRLSPREMFLGWVTIVVVVLGLTAWTAQSKIGEWRQTYDDLAGLKRRIRRAERTLNSRAEIETRFETIMSELPAYQPGKDVTAELLKTLERTAQDHGLTLLRREPQPEKSLGDLYQVSINCTWESDLKALAHFLYAIHTKGAILDIRQLTVTPVQGQQGRLKGGFTVDCAYTRTAQEAGQGGVQVEVAP